jgi:membrane protein YqaA with SNARE-associated domain
MPPWKERIERLAESPHALVWLFAIACAEASVVPIPPDFLLVALCLARPGRSMKFAAICTAGSTVGALLGYVIGYAVLSAPGGRFVGMEHMPTEFAGVLEKYREHSAMAIVLGGFTPIPFALFSLAAGFHGTLPLAAFIPAIVVGRALRFFLVAGLLRYVAPRVQWSVPGVLRALSMVVGSLLLLGFLTMKYLY